MAIDDAWAFEDPRDLGVFVTTDVFAQRSRIEFVTHDADGDWAFSGGQEFIEDNTVLVHLDWVANEFPDVAAAVSDLPRGWYAERSISGWVRDRL